MKRLLIAAVLFSTPAFAAEPAAPASKDDLAVKKKTLQGYADLLESLSDEDYRDVVKDGAKPQLVSRPAALSKIYDTLAGLEYRQALEAGVEEAARAEAEGALKSRADADAVAIDPQTLQESGWADDLRGYVNQYSQRFQVRTPTAVLAVRGGRKIPTAADKEFLKKRKQIDEAHSALASADTEKRGGLHLSAARLWADLASASRSDAPKDDLAAKKKKLQQYADFMESLSDEDFRDLTKNSSAQLASRPATLSKIYATLGGLEYKQALEAGVEGDAREEAESALTSRSDADKVAIDPSTLKATGWWDSFTNYVNSDPPLRHRVTAVAAVRGGRKIRTAGDAAAQKTRKKLEETELAMASMEAKSHGTLHLTAARLWDELAVAVSRPAPEAKEMMPAPAATIKELSPRQVYEKASPSVVLILAADKSGAGEIGTGSVIDEEGRVLTNAHVVVNDATSQPFATVKVYYKPARMTGDPKRDLSDAKLARVLRYDRALDLALLEIGEPRSVPPLALSDSSDTGPGDTVVAIGHPEQGGLWTLTQGVISTVVAELGGVKGKAAFQTDASINRGNSGGPLINRAGEVIGVNTSMARKAPDGLTITAVNFAVKSEVARRWLGDAAPAPRVYEAPAKPVEKPAATEPEPVAEAPAAVKPAAPAKILTPAKPFTADDLISQQMKEMEDLEDEMRGEIEKRRKAFETSTP